MDRSLGASRKIPMMSTYQGPVLKRPVTEQQAYLMVAAIDFGTAYSGYAFALISDGHDIRMNKNWGGGTFESYKTPTSVLFGPHGFMDFGYDSERQYHEIERNDLDLFRHFKMLLHDKCITKSLKISATNGHKRLAIDVFAEALRYLKNHMLEAIDKTVVSDMKELDMKMIRWVITLPAIWRDDAKQFMREATLKAGLITSRTSNQLVLALEPEAASIFCREIPVDPIATLHRGRGGKCSFDVGIEYLIIDAGGGTVDITAHKILNGGMIKEILQPTGGPWGGTEVDKAFEELVSRNFGEEVVTGLKKECAQEWLTFMLNFENAKKHIKSNDTGTNIRLEMNFTFCTKYQELSGKSIVGLKQTTNPHVYFTNGKLVIDHNTCVQLFKPVVRKTAVHVQQILRKPEMGNISFVLLVGGFGECEILQSEIKAILPNHIKMMVPEEAQLAIIKGAVQYGLSQNVVKSRIAPRTYGIDIEPRFNERVHDSRKKIRRQGTDYCNDVFLKFIAKDTPVEFDEVTSRTLLARTDDQDSMSFDIYCTDATLGDQVEYVSDPKFLRIGGLTVFMPDKEGGRNRKVDVQFKFGGTEIQVEARDLTSGQTAKTEVDMLLP